jgi:hypothetical protein
MRRIIYGVVAGFLLSGIVRGVDLGVVSTSDYVRFEVEALDSAGIPVSPDSGHVLIWFEGESSVDAVSYTCRWTNAGAGSAYIDSTRLAGHTYYYFVDQVVDIDNDEGQGVFTGVVVLYADVGLPTSTPFTFTLAGDELTDYLALLNNLDESVSGIDDNPWDNPDRQLTALDEDNTDVDLDGALLGSGSGAYSVTFVTYDTTNDQVVPGVCLAVRNLDQTVLLASVVTDVSGRASANLDVAAYLISATAPGYLFDAYDTVTISGAGSDTVRGTWFDPGTPGSPSLCRVYGYLFTTDGKAEAGARISAWLPNGVTLSSNVIISPTPVATTTNDLGYFYLDLVPSTLLTGHPKYEITINRSDGTILRKRLSVPDTGNWQLSW